VIKNEPTYAAFSIFTVHVFHSNIYSISYSMVSCNVIKVIFMRGEQDDTISPPDVRTIGGVRLGQLLRAHTV
jgi:hypothetical protein